MVGQALVRSQMALTPMPSRPILAPCCPLSWPTSSPATVPAARLTGDATEPGANGYMLTVDCSCGVVFMRWVTPAAAAEELALSRLLASARWC
jgi:hypothetical protein